jgi:hypothetical protein
MKSAPTIIELADGHCMELPIVREVHQKRRR